MGVGLCCGQAPGITCETHRSPCKHYPWCVLPQRGERCSRSSCDPKVRPSPFVNGAWSGRCRKWDRVELQEWQPAPLHLPHGDFCPPHWTPTPAPPTVDPPWDPFWFWKPASEENSTSPPLLLRQLLGTLVPVISRKPSATCLTVTSHFITPGRVINENRGTAILKVWSECPRRLKTLSGSPWGLSHDSPPPFLFSISHLCPLEFSGGYMTHDDIVSLMANRYVLAFSCT